MGNINELIIKTSAIKQEILIGDFEIIDYGTSVTSEDLEDELDGLCSIKKAASNGYRAYYICDAITTQNDEGGEDDMIITNEQFIDNAILTKASNGNISRTKDTYGKLDFTDTVTVTCTNPGSLTSFGVVCGPVSTAHKNQSGELCTLEFYARAKEKSAQIRACVLNDSDSPIVGYTYYIPTQWTKICLPFNATGTARKAAFYFGSAANTVELGGVSLRICGEDEDIYTIEQGYFLQEEFNDICLEYSDAENYIAPETITKCADICSDGDYLYAIGNGTFYIVSKKDPANPVVTGKLSGFGNVRQIRITDDGTIAVITSREDAAFIVSCEDKYNPELLSRYDSVEYATGIAIAERRAYITNRMYGVEIVDFQDPENPKNLSIVRTGEAQSCEIVDGKLFAGCWSERRIEVWDVSQPSEPFAINTNIPVNGKGDGLAVRGKYMYVATGHSENTGESGNNGQTVGLPGYGLGNGLDIYDISDLWNPVWCSTVKIDDHFYAIGQDFWTVKVAEHDGRIYAYLTNTFNGVYVYDVTDPRTPIRIDKIALTIKSGTSKYNSYLSSHGTNDGSSRYFPYNVSDHLQTPVGGLYCTDGYMYIAGINTGIATLSDEEYADKFLYEQYADDSTEEQEGDLETFYDLNLDALDKAGFKNVEYYNAASQVYAATEVNGIIYAACGNGGIYILDDNLDLIKIVPRDGIVADIQKCGNRLYTAEGKDGVAVYEISEDGCDITEISRYRTHSSYSTSPLTTKQIRLSKNGNFVLSESGGAGCDLIDFRDIKNPKSWQLLTFTAYMYHRQMCNGLVDGRYLCAYAYNKETAWFDFGNDDGNDPVLLCEYSPSGVNAMASSLCPAYGEYNDNVVYLRNNAYSMIKPAELTSSTMISSYSTIPFYGTNGTSQISGIAGKPISFGYLLFVPNRITGTVYICDFSDPLKGATLLWQYTFAGTPDVAYCDEDFVLLPLGYQGLLKFSVGYNASIRDTDGVIEYFGSVEDALAKADDGDTVTLHNTVTITSGIAVPAGVTLDVSKCEYTLNSKITLGEGSSVISHTDIYDRLSADTYIGVCEDNGNYVYETSEFSKDILSLNGVQIRLKGIQGLRFISKVNQKLEDCKFTDYGFVVIPKDLSQQRLTVLSATQVQSISHRKLGDDFKYFSLGEDSFEYTVCIMQIPISKYTRKFIARPFFRYEKDKKEYTVYADMDEKYILSVYDVAAGLIAQDDENRETLQKIIDEYEAQK